MLAKMGRPRKWKDGFKLTSIMIPREYEAIWDKAAELAQREGVTLSELVAKALAEYCKLHLDGNPYPPLMSERPFLEYRNELAKRRLQAFLEWAEKWPKSPRRVEEFEPVFNYVSRVKVLRVDVEELLEKAIGVARGPVG